MNKQFGGEIKASPRLLRPLFSRSMICDARVKIPKLRMSVVEDVQDSSSKKKSVNGLRCFYYQKVVS